MRPAGTVGVAIDFIDLPHPLVLHFIYSMSQCHLPVHNNAALLGKSSGGGRG